ncbi:hypothetical protein C0995_002632 [Termitomyces sp. Mi166|nr:hypothetical protein C0995_002632 [Termitomyces sp. Mi166\
MASDDEAYSDLTDLSEEDDEYGGSSSKSKKKGRNSSPSGGYRIRNALKVPRATTYTAQALYDQMHGDDIKLDPDYQRDVVWPDSKMVGLIDSVFRNFYVPPVIFSVVSYDDGSEKRICIDGKQRLTSIQRFMDGLPNPNPDHNPRHTSQKLWYTDTGAGGGKQKKKLLPLKYRKLFANKQIVCVEYTDVTDSDEREIFQRVQLGMALTPAEKLQVANTPRSAFIRSLVSHFLTASPTSSEDSAGSLAHFDWERTRGADYRSISQIVYCLYTFPAFAPPGTATDLKRANSLKNLGQLSTLEKFLLDPAPFTDDFQENVRAVLMVIGTMATDRRTIGSGNEKIEVREVFRNPTRVAPVELVSIGLLVGSHMHEAGCTGAIGGGKKENKLEKGEREEREVQGRRRLAEGIRQMRAEVRDMHVDIRMNARVGKTMVDFVRSWRPDMVTASSSSTAVVGSSSTSIGKRKRTTSSGKGSVEDGQATTDDEHDVRNGKVEDDDSVPLRLKLKFKKIAGGPSPPKYQSPPPLPSVPLPSLPNTLAPKPLSISIPAPSSQKPDRMAALRAVKLQMQMQGGGGGGGGNGPLPQAQSSGGDGQSPTNPNGSTSTNGRGHPHAQDTGWRNGSASSSGGRQVEPPWGQS